MKKIVFALGILALTSTVPVAANPIAYNTEEFRLSGYLDADTFAGTEFSIEGGYGYFFQDFTEAGVILGLQNNDILTSVSAGTFIEYNFETDYNFVPFVGSQLRLIYAEYDYSTFDDSTTALAAGLYAGIKLFITDNLAVSARALVEAATDDIYAEEDDVSNVDFIIDFGLRFFN